MSFSPGDIVLVAFPFTDTSSRKKRPALVISPEEYSLPYNDVVFLALTSQQQSDTLKLAHWEESGLLRETWCKPIIASISSHYLVSHLGRLHESDTSVISHALKTIIDERFR